MRKGLLISMALMLMVFLSAPMLVAQEKGMGGKEKAAIQKEKATCEKEKAPCEKEMKLTDEETARIEELKMDFRLKTIDLKAEQQKLALMLKKEMMKPEPSIQEIEGIIRKMSPVREKIQLASVEHALAMRKLLGPRWRTMMRPGLGECCEMGEDPGMACAGEGNDVMIMRKTMPGSAKGCGMGAMEGGCMMQKSRMCEGRMGAMKGCGMMHKSGMREGCRGAMKGGCMMMPKGGSCSSHMNDNWRQRMFRPFGRKGCCSGKGGMMGCMGETGCMKEGAPKEIKCKIELKEKKEN